MNTPTTRIHVPAIATQLRDGWTVSDRTVITLANGVEAVVRLDRAPDDGDAAQLMRDRLDALAERGITAHDVTESTTAMNGDREVPQLRCRLDDQGSEWNGRLVCSIEHGLALSMSVTWPVDGDDHDGLDEEFDALINGVVLLNSPAAPLSSEGTPAEVPPIPPFDHAAWAGLAERWAETEPILADTTDRGRWSPHELAVCAGARGAGPFPTIGDALAELSEPERNAIVGAVAASLSARGLVDGDGDGSGEASIDAALADLVDLGGGADIVISVSTVEPTGRRWWTLCLTPDRGLQVEVLADTSRACAEVEPVAAVGHVMAFGGLQRDGAPADAYDSSVTEDDVTAGAGPVRRLVHVQVAWADDGAVRGGIVSWALDADDRTWLANVQIPTFDKPSTDPLAGNQAFDQTVRWTLQQANPGDIRAALVEALPGNG